MIFGFLWVFGNIVDEFVVGMVIVGGRNWLVYIYLFIYVDDYIVEEECMILCGGE